ncbi:MAG: hypothetical protein V1824_00025 [archaeon]
MALIISKQNFNNKNKGQESAPFEVLVAVIIMAFVILAGSYALKNLNENVCLGNKTKDISEFVNSLRDVVLGSDLTFRTINFTTKSCFNSKYEKIQLNSYESSTKCSAYCGSGDNCLLMEYTYNKDNTPKMPIAPVCTYLSPTLNLVTENIELDCGVSGEEWESIDRENIKPGKYRVYKVSSSNDSASTIKLCMLKEK